MSASLRKRPKCCVAGKRRYVPQADICSAAKKIHSITPSTVEAARHRCACDDLDSELVCPEQIEQLPHTFGSARPALVSLLSLSTISAGIFLGAPRPHTALAS